MADAGTLELRADLACILAEVALTPATGGAVAPEEAERRRTTALAMLEAAELPIAIIELPSETPALVNARWRQLVSPDGGDPLARLPKPMRDRLVAITAGDPVGFPELAIQATEHREHPEPIALAVRPLHGATGAIAGVVLVARDLTLAGEPLVWGGPAGGEADHRNHAWTTYTGDAALTAPWIHPDDRARCGHAFAEAARHRRSSDIDVRLRRADGVYRWHRVRFGIEGARWHGTAHDIHDARSAATRDELGVRERAARADAEQANRMKDQFLAAVSHELRAPLTTMLLWEKVLRGSGQSEELRAKALEVIHVSVQAQSRIVADLMDVSRAISGKLHVDLRPVDITSVIEEAIAAAAPMAHAKNVALVREGTAALGEVEGDIARLRQVFENLLSNAIKFTESGGRVTVTAARHGRSVAIAVADTGRGIAADFMPGLFEPFTQIEDELTRRDGGLGLGLAIAKQLVELHHGVLTAGSEGLGRGATFTVTLPASRVRRVSSPPAGVTPAQLLRGCKILVIDDDARVRDALALLLERAGAAITTADSAESARAKIADALPQALVCDIAMPGEDGYSFVQWLRGRGVRAPAIALTAHASDTAARRALEAGFDRHLAKPIDIERLISCIHDLVTASPR